MDRRTKLIVGGLALVAFLVHLRIAPGFTWMRDETYFLSCADHLAWGYADHPSGVVLIAAAARRVFGNSLLGQRLVPALSNAATILAVAALTRALGGRRHAIVFACTTALIAPIYLAFGSFMSTNLFEPAIWGVMLTLVVRMLDGASQRLWLWFGLLAGVGLEFKPSLLALGFSLVAALLLTRRWTHFRQRWIWLGGLIAFALLLPYIVWNARHGWISAELYSVANSYDRTAMPLWDFTLSLVELMNPLTVGVWISGLAWLVAYRSARAYRPLGVAFLVYYILMLALHAKTYYIGAAFVPLLAAGALWRQEWIEKDPRRRAWIRPATLVLFALGGCLIAPMALPVLSPAQTVAYVPQAVRKQAYDAPHGPRGALWLPLADETGWPEMVASVADAWRTLAPDEQRRAAILATNYGEAAAIDQLGTPYGLPHAVSGHNSYYFWGLDERSARADVLILVGERRMQVGRECASLQTGATFTSIYGRPFENGPILVCRGLKRPLAALWPDLKRWGQD